ncbi:MAG: undecaprenyl/decaprenyl-phosphate alpha-N-acetylglucosaminyl 1-phosphate transferase [Gemmatimonadaceae bacterium]|nr:undecaprenyl/decaprenyl-phosphate alpha-N-acetylglucosaminyl 1-phosphate transferase [Gemmatimonadaceae bacterium]
MQEGDISAFHFLVVVLAPLLVSQFVTPFVISAARRMDLVDSPDGFRRIHDTPVPRIGGVAVLASFAFALFFIRDVIGGESGVIGVLAGCAIVSLVGLYDDLRGVSPRVKVIAQLVAAAVAWSFSPQLHGIALGYTSEFALGWLGLPVLMLWVVVVSNGYNLIDGINGLASAVGIVGAFAAAAISLALGNHVDALLALALASALCGFSRFNFPKARIFLGDAGSLTIGFLLAMLTVRGASRPSGSVVLVVPVLALLVPLFETGLTIARRWLRSVSVVVADAHHIHHRLLAVGFGHSGATLVLGSASAIFATLGVALGVAGPTMMWVFSVLAIGAVVLSLLLAVSVLSYHEIGIAAEVLMTGPSRARRVIRDQIAATDLAARVQTTTSIDALNEMLALAASDFSFVKMSLLHRGMDVISADPPGRVWRLEFPLSTPDSIPSFAGFAISVLCGANGGSRPFGAERVIHILAPALEAWIVDHQDALATEYAAAASGTAKARRSVMLRMPRGGVA